MDIEKNVKVQEYFQKIYQRSNRVIEISLACYFIFGLAISPFYDTWMIALSVGLLLIGMYAVAKWFFPKKTLNQYIAGCTFALFMAQFIYQMHGLFEMHFFAFVGTILLITYQNWKVFIPITLLIVVHHAAFAYLQFIGYEEVYFTQLDYMTLTTFLFHVGLAAVIIGLCAFWAFDFRKQTEKALVNSLKIQEQLTHSEQNMTFAAEIANGNLDMKKNREESDALGCSLIDMQEKLKEAKLREQREKFVNVGLAEVSDILRKNVNSLDTLSEKVLAYLVKYLSANQGAIFIANLHHESDEQLLTMTACYAYDKKKFQDKTVKVGQGLVGQAYLEKKTTYLKKIPQDYINITSGLGEATPGYLLIVPLIVNEGIEGVIELASFEEFSADAIQFLEKVGESIASMVSSSKTTQHTTQLLEAARSSEEELRAAEEEMRQNNEELQAIQEEISRKEKKQAQLLQAVQQSIGVMEINSEGEIVQTNDTLAYYLGYQANELKDQAYTKVIDKGPHESDSLAVLREQIKMGENRGISLQLQHRSSEISTVAASANPVDSSDSIMLLFWIEQTVESET